MSKLAKRLSFSPSTKTHDGLCTTSNLTSTILDAYFNKRQLQSLDQFVAYVTTQLVILRVHISSIQTELQLVQGLLEELIQRVHDAQVKQATQAKHPISVPVLKRGGGHAQVGPLHVNHIARLIQWLDHFCLQIKDESNDANASMDCAHCVHGMEDADRADRADRVS